MIFNRKKVNEWMIISLVLAVILLGIIVYFVINGYREANEERGYAYAITQIVQQAADCQSVSLYAGNVTMQLVDISCLNASKKT